MKKAKISMTKEIAFPAKHSAERGELVQLLKQEGLCGNVEDLDISALKKIVQNREWSEDVLSKPAPYQKENAPTFDSRRQAWTIHRHP
jgi:hypothetical protein